MHLREVALELFWPWLQRYRGQALVEDGRYDGGHLEQAYLAGFAAGHAFALNQHPDEAEPTEGRVQIP